MKKKRHPFAELDDIGYIGVPSSTRTPEDWAFIAEKSREARLRYSIAHEVKLAFVSRVLTDENRTEISKEIEEYKTTRRNKAPAYA